MSFIICKSVNNVLVGLVCLSIASGVSCSSGVGSSDSIIMCLESEREALSDFKQGLVDFNALASWKSEKNCCRWRGITCNNLTGHVTSLDLSTTNFLRGEIHPSLLALRHLNYLDLSSIDFEGRMIPKFIGSLSQLKHLKLRDDNFSGPIPSHLRNLSNLQTLDLSYNEHMSSENIEWLSHLSSLSHLDMSQIDLSKALNWPLSISKLTSLKELKLSNCNLPNVDPRSLSIINSSTSLQHLELTSNSLNSSILYWIANVSTNFVDIDLFGNELQGLIPVDVFSNMHSLVSIDLSGNQLEGGVLKHFPNSCNFESFRLRFNKFSENIKESLETLACADNTLKILDLSANRFWGSFPDLTRFSNLVELNFEDNNLNGSLPENVSQLYSLEQLSLSGNLFTGVLTESFFQNLSRLRSLEFFGNSLSFNISSDWIPPFQLTAILDMTNCKLGTGFPKWVLTQTNLTYLHLSNCELSGPLPNELLEGFSSLSTLDLSMNQLDGNLPNLATPPMLDRIDLSSNQFSGTVPSLPPNLDELYLSNNKLSELSSSFCSTPPPYLEKIDISNNLLSGVLPDCWMPFEDLKYLQLRHNNLSGNLPNSLGYLQALSILLLNDNNFSGELASLENCSELSVVDLGGNNFSGKIPAWIAETSSQLLILRLSSNKLSGIIPLSLCDLGVIHILDLSHNNISGALPHCFNNITALPYDSDTYNVVIDIAWKGIESEFGFNLWHLRFIDLSSNSLTGEIPESIITMQNLISLNLSRNMLTGKLPEMFGNMTNLESLDLSRNHISGQIPSSFSSLNFLEVLDLSYNKLSGRIPQSTQLQSFSASKFAGNLRLCGPPLSPNCHGDEPTQPTEEHIDDDGLISWGFLTSLVLGFITGFWTVCCSLLLKRSWRHAYFGFLDRAQDWVYVKLNVYRRKKNEK